MGHADDLLVPGNTRQLFRYALGSDAGAYLGPLVKGALEEYDLLKEELGENTDLILQTGEDMLRWKFGGLA